MAGEWRSLNNGDLNDLHSSPNIIRVIKRRIIGLTGHVTRMGREEVHEGCWWGNMRESDHLEELGGNGRMILKRISKK